MTKEVIIECVKDISKSLQHQGTGADIHLVSNLRHTADTLVLALEIGIIETHEAEAVYRRLHDSVIKFWSKKFTSVS